MSGSRTTLICGAVGTLLLIVALIRDSARVGSASRHTSSLVAGAAVVVVLLMVGATAVGPVRRMLEVGPPGRSTVRALWSRGGYGTVALRMIRDYPLVGVGVGSFNWLAPDYWRVLSNDKLPFDNAQNWWRHQVAELGIIGGLPLLAWSVLVAWL